MKKIILLSAMVSILASIPISAIAADWWIEKGWPVATSEELLDRMMEIISENDKAAWQDLMNRNPGKAAVTTQSSKVYGVKVHFLGPTEFRFPGTSTIFFAPSQAIVDEKPD